MSAPDDLALSSGHRSVDDEATREAMLPLVEAAEERFRTAEDRALFVIRTAIDRGMFGPGERLPQDRLASLIGSSRMPVRSALRQLESEGFVTLEPHRGAVVRSVGESEIRDLYELRIVVESFALKRVAVRAGPEELRSLDDLAARIDSAETLSDRATLMDEFYRRLYTIGNPARIVALVMQLRSEVNRYGTKRTSGTEPHRELLDALSMDDPDLAAAWLAAHLRRLARRATGLDDEPEAPSDGE